ncbi:glycosyltransferase [Lachnospiraceae bacterium ASD5720]|uniref:Glycosyltransferase n=1 Tax=Diplocloster agilis TaxID=2850323 RepID=A0A949NAK0_9FIRM|nr:glycosyltransferase [Diplocloster agilis]
MLKQEKSLLKKICNLIYIYEESKKKNEYLGWLLQKSKIERYNLFYNKFKYEFIYYDNKENEDNNRIIDFDIINSDYIVFVNKNGKISKEFKRVISKYISKHKDSQIIYTNEDEISSKKELIKYKNPFFKPEWSIDTLISYMYFGSCIIIKTDFIKKYFNTYTIKSRADIYQLLLSLVWHKPIINRVEKILYHYSDLSNLLNENCIFEIANAKYRFLNHDINQKCLLQLETNTKCYLPIYEHNINDMVSIIIPSKDNASILKVCILSILKYTKDLKYEIIVVDNGSNKSCRKEIEDLSLAFNFKYYYEPMEFNFSKMCNYGVKKSQGNFILFLNDDIEVVQYNWLNILIGQAKRPWTGAVGAKLLYPDKEHIQHIGITNGLNGPIHKLAMFRDDKDWCFGRNHLLYNYIAVTGACLVIEKEKFINIGGFDEKLKIRYNDVDLGWRLYKKGYFNVVRNDVELIHCESISRGLDNDNNQKLEQLKIEKNLLFQNHKDFLNHDPLLSENIVQSKAGFDPDYCQDYDLNKTNNIRKSNLVIKNQWIDDSINLYIEKVIDNKELIYIEGWSFLKSHDNSFYKKQIILRKEPNFNTALIASVYFKYRNDIVDLYKAEKNIGLSGFICKIPRELIQKDIKYNIGILYTDKLNKRKRFIASNNQILVK